MMSEPEKLNGESQDVAAAKRAELKQLFPGAVTETVNENGELVASVDFERLKAELGEFSDLFERRRERYGMEWPGKGDCLKVIQEQSMATLKPCREESVNFDATENLFIEGDNLEVLKLLQKSYHGQVKMIYIDPPYNTGNEFIYPDNFSESIDTYLEYAGLLDDQGRRIESKKNSKDEGRFHTKWLNMMYPRLYLARNLLRDDGVIFISIDDNEVSNLRKLCDEVFGEENFMGNIARATGQTTGQDGGGLGSSFDFVLVYAKDAKVDLSGLPLTDKDKTRFENEDERGFYAYDQMRKTGSSDRREDRPNMFYSVYAPDGTEVLPMAPNGYEGRWRFEKKTYEKYLKDGYILWKKTKRDSQEMWWPYVKYYLEGRTKRPSPLWNDLDGNKKAARDLRELFDGKKVFDFPKPTALIERCIQIVPDSDDNDIILDFFAGAGSLGDAVLRMNCTQGGNRKFIMVQLPEPCDEKLEAGKAGYKTIADIGKERIRRVIQKIEAEQAEKAKASKGELDLDGEKEAAKPPDLGFRVLKLDKSNFKAWQPLPADADEAQIKKALQGHLFHVDETATQEAILYEILLKAGFMPSTRVETLKLAGKTVYSVAEGMLFICLEDEITRELIDAVVDKLPQQFICLDRGFKGNDQLKANTVQTFSALNESKDKDTKIIFRTV